VEPATDLRGPIVSSSWPPSWP